MIRIKYNSSRLFNILTVIILSGLCWLLNELTQINFRKLELPKDKPEFSANKLSGKLYNQTGKLTYEVMAESSIEYPDSSKIFLVDLNLKAFSESTDDLKQSLTSKDGWIDPRTSMAFLGRNVVLEINNKDPKQVVRVYTDNVLLNGITKFASSSAPVRVTQAKSVLTGVGFTVDYQKQFIKVESNVKVVYEK